MREYYICNDYKHVIVMAAACAVLIFKCKEERYEEMGL